MEVASPTAAPGRRRRKAARPAELIDAAIEVFAEKGFAAARIEEVAHQAGVSKGTAYLYFPNKEALFKAAVHEVVVTRIAMGERDIEAWQGSSAALLRHVLEEWAQVIRSRRGGLLKLIVAEARNFPELAAWYHQEVAERGQRLLRAVLSRGVAQGEFRPIDVEATAHVIACPMAFRAIWSHSLGPYETPPVSDDRFYATYFDFALAGLLADRPSDKGK
ncbi:MAG TPA: TetR/AcrR family transcriptional regulator [Stellaceae bacterium]|jgi:AcrR family transcriptional regulator|nr:TetR/AcrR family transcriptional regulator [Stellaceae bacterium]